MKDLASELELQCTRLYEYICAACDAKTRLDHSLLYRRIADTLCEVANRAAAVDALQSEICDIESINADEAVVEVVDSATGRVFRRSVELCYEENANGFALKGETMDGCETSIVFLSETAVRKVSDVTGAGADEDHCGRG